LVFNRTVKLKETVLVKGLKGQPAEKDKKKK